MIGRDKLEEIENAPPAESTSPAETTSPAESAPPAPARLAGSPIEGAEGPAAANLVSITPRQIVAELDRYIISQGAAKKAVAIALRNRWRRRQVEGDLREEILPNNIIMIGPTGVGKTEIARRLARLAGAPFLKVEASKFTEVGYVGRDVESMVRDLVEISINMVRSEREDEHRETAAERVEERLLDLLLPPRRTARPASSSSAVAASRRKRPRMSFRTGAAARERSCEACSAMGSWRSGRSKSS